MSRTTDEMRGVAPRLCQHQFASARGAVDDCCSHADHTGCIAQNHGDTGLAPTTSEPERRLSVAAGTLVREPQRTRDVDAPLSIKWIGARFPNVIRRLKNSRSDKRGISVPQL